MNLLIGLCAFGGLILTLVGRVLIIQDARSFSLGWAIAIRCLPCADLLYLARFWDSAKTGAFLSITGLFLMMPAGAKALWDSKHPKPPQQKGSMLKLLDGDARNSIYQDLRFEREARAALKEEKLQQLNVRMTGWYETLEARRAALAQAAPAELEEFNREAAAYSELRALTQQETDALAKLRASIPENWGQLTEADVAEYAGRQRRSGPRGSYGVEP